MWPDSSPHGCPHVDVQPRSSAKFPTSEADIGLPSEKRDLPYVHVDRRGVATLRCGESPRNFPDVVPTDVDLYTRTLPSGKLAKPLPPLPPARASDEFSSVSYRVSSPPPVVLPNSAGRYPPPVPPFKPVTPSSSHQRISDQSPPASDTSSPPRHGVGSRRIQDGTAQLPLHAAHVAAGVVHMTTVCNALRQRTAEDRRCTAITSQPTDDLTLGRTNDIRRKLSERTGSATLSPRRLHPRPISPDPSARPCTVELPPTPTEERRGKCPWLCPLTPLASDSFKGTNAFILNHQTHQRRESRGSNGIPPYLNSQPAPLQNGAACWDGGQPTPPALQQPQQPQQPQQIMSSTPPLSGDMARQQPPPFTPGPPSQPVANGSPKPSGPPPLPPGGLSNSTIPAPPAPPPPPPVPGPGPATSATVSRSATLPPSGNVTPPPSTGGLAAALKGATLKKVAKSDDADSSCLLDRSGTIGRNATPRPINEDMMSEMTRKLKARRIRAEGGDATDGNDSNGGSKPWEKNGKPNNGSESPKIGRSRRFQSLTGQETISLPSNNGNGGTGGGNGGLVSVTELDLLKQEILSEVRREVNKAKMEIIEAFKAELNRR